MKRLFTFLTTFMLMSVVIPARAADLSGIVLPFNDIAKSVHVQAIVELYNRGVVQGYPGGTYRPNQTISRVEFLKILTETKGDYSPSRDPSGYDIEAPVGLSFSDIRSKKWFVPYVRNALQLKIISGYPDGTFRPDAPINLAEALKIIYLTFKLPTVQFIREPDHWYDYYTAGLDEEFSIETHLNATTDIGKKITRGEMASMILYFEAKAANLTSSPTPALETVAGSYLVIKPLILERKITNGTWTLNGFVMFSNGCYKPKIKATVSSSGFPEQVNLEINEVIDQLGMCIPTPKEFPVSFSFDASAGAKVTAHNMDEKALFTIIHDPDLERGNAFAPVRFKRSSAKNVTILNGTLNAQSCSEPITTTTVYDGTHQQVEIDIVIAQELTGLACSRTKTEWPLTVELPLLEADSIFRARINGEPVQLLVE
jgi:hypothetical protein